MKEDLVTDVAPFVLLFLVGLLFFAVFSITILIDRQIQECGPQIGMTAELESELDRLKKEGWEVTVQPPCVCE